MRISVIIPTYNRLEILKLCIDALKKQTISPEQFQTIIVDDGSDDGTVQWLQSLKSNDDNLKVSVILNKHGGPARARNAGLDIAVGEVILFLGDDIIADARLLEEHLAWREKFPGRQTAVLGLITWHKEIKITPFMKWLEDSGSLFPYHKIEHEKLADYRFFYTSNVSVSRDFIGNQRFDESFPYASREDIEFAFRLQKKGLKLYFNQNAIGYHHHELDVKKFQDRCFISGRCAYLLDSKHKGDPEYIPVPISKDESLIDKIKSRCDILFPIANILQDYFAPDPICRKIMEYSEYLGYQEQKAKHGNEKKDAG